jgi:exodeoxyribonuclease-1
MAKLLRSAQPKLYDYAYNSRSKVAVRAQFDLVTQKPVVFVSMAFPARLGCLSLVMPLCAHPTNTNAIIACDLRVDPTHWLGLSGEELAARLYKRRSDLPVGEDPLPLHVIATNKCPVVAPLGVLDETVAAEYGVDKSVWLPHFEAVRAKLNVAATVTKAFSQAGEGDPETDPDFMIYSGFFGDSDKKLMQTVLRSAPADLGRLDIPFRDLRLKEMLFRYRARNYPETLTEEEVVVWREFCLNRINDPEARKKYDLGFAEALERGGDAARPLLDELNAYVASLPIAAGNQ